MTSPYSDKIDAYGRNWHRPWMAVFVGAVAYLGLNWLIVQDGPQLICTPKPDSPWRPVVNLHRIAWTADLEAALECACQNDRDVLIAFHTVSDTNAKMNEMFVARQHNLRPALNRHVLVMLHTDVTPKEFYIADPTFLMQRSDANRNHQFQQREFGDETSPLYAIVRPMGNGQFAVLGVYAEGRINDGELLRNHNRSRLWENFRMKLRALVPILFALVPLLTACNRAENGGGVENGGRGLFAGDGRAPTLKFAEGSCGGCADVFVFKATADKREYLLVRADKEKLKLPALGSKTFDLADAPDGLAVQIDLWVAVPRFEPYCNCVSEGSKREATWKAKSGKVTITLGEAEALKDEGPMRRYKASARLENVVFEDDTGRKTTLKEESISEVIVGWYAG